MKKNGKILSRYIVIPLLLAAAVAASSCKSYPNKGKINSALELYSDYRPNENNPRDVMLYIHAFGKNANLDVNGAKDAARAVSYITSNAGVKGWAIMETTDPKNHGLPFFVERVNDTETVRVNNKETTRQVVRDVETAPGMFVSILIASGLDRNYIITTANGESPNMDAFVTAMLYYLNPTNIAASPDYAPGQSGNAVGWTLAALSDYGFTEIEWPNKDNMIATANGKTPNKNVKNVRITDLINIAVSRPPGWGENAGLDEGFGLADSVIRHRIVLAREQTRNTKKETGPFDVVMTGPWDAARKRLDETIALAKKNQLPDGTISSTWFKSATQESDVVMRTRYTARMLAVLSAAMPDKQLTEDWVEKLVSALCDLMENNKQAIQKDPVTTSYAVHALQLYRSRMPGETPKQGSPCILPAKTCGDTTPTKEFNIYNNPTGSK